MSFIDNTLVKHNLSLKHRLCCDMLKHQKPTPLPVAFRGHEVLTLNQSAKAL